MINQYGWLYFFERSLGNKVNQKQDSCGCETALFSAWPFL